MLLRVNTKTKQMWLAPTLTSPPILVTDPWLHSLAINYKSALDGQKFYYLKPQANVDWHLAVLRGWAINVFHQKGFQGRFSPHGSMRVEFETQSRM